MIQLHSICFPISANGGRGMSNLKDYRNKELKYYTIANIIIVLLASGLYVDLIKFITGISEVANENTGSMVTKILSDLAGIGILSSVIYVYIFVIDSIISSDLKYKICYLHFCDKPGCTIFSKMRDGEVDDRFTREDVVQKYEVVYKKLSEMKDGKSKKNYENKEWYSIYNNYRDKGMIVGANRDYLLCRDLCVATLSMIVAYLIFVLVTEVKLDCKIILFLIVEFIFMDIAFWAKGMRLARNVIALDIHNSQKNECKSMGD